ncbi:25494_t:CDS:2 [Gigaspora rosea]|nr:25494_t:CDS:2 [Gigaspora rosea]
MELIEICELQQPVRDAHDIEYSKLIDDIGDGVDGENVSLKLLKTTCEMNNVIEFTFLETLKGNAIDLYSTDSIADNDMTKTNQTQRNIVNVELLNPLNASGVPKHRLTLKKGCVATIMRNLSLHDSLCKNSKVIILDVGQKLVTVQNTTTNSIVYLPRITFPF